jgi:starch phosphorylase
VTQDRPGSHPQEIQTMPLSSMVERLEALANNLWWSWDTEASALWAEADPFRWERHHHNPVALMRDIEPERWELLEKTTFAVRVDQVWRRFREYLEAEPWSAQGAPELLAHGIAYFSMEFGLHESLRLYSGGLGILAGDHLRSASDLGIPLVGVSLLWRQGYFRQFIEDGRQLAAYLSADWRRLPIRPSLDTQGHEIVVEVAVGARQVQLKVWQLDVGRCRLLLLDSDLPDNTPADRELTRLLYGGDERMRIEQEVLLGIGGVKALRALGLDVGVFHLNEGHCGFVTLGLVAERMEYDGEALEEAVAAVRERCVFTTHTPVPAGHDRFPAELVHATLGRWAEGVGIELPELMDLGRVKPGDETETFCMTVVALRTCVASNGVSALHGAVSREMWRGLWPDRPVDEVPIHHVTNGVHPLYWTAPDTRALFDRYVPGWREQPWDPEIWAQVDHIPDEEWLKLRASLRQQLVETINRTSGRHFDPNLLILGFARRFAPYKRGNLLFREPERLRQLLRKYPLQIVYAGKAHPRDGHGQEIVAEVVRWSEAFEFRDRVVLLQDYDMRLGRQITAGADVWLNNPRRPQEASGTSGQKVVLNGGLNLSVLDGWWPEGFDGTNGWAIGLGEEWTDESAQDAHDSEALYRLLEEQVLPEWTDRPTGTPARWIERIRRSLKTCAPKFTSHRMVRDYTLEFYSPRCR